MDYAIMNTWERTLEIAIRKTTKKHYQEALQFEYLHQIKKLWNTQQNIMLMETQRFYFFFSSIKWICFLSKSTNVNIANCIQYMNYSKAVSHVHTFSFDEIE